MMSLFDEYKNDSRRWYNKASDLHCAAELLWAGISRTLPTSWYIAYPVYYMLCGMSIELILKATCIAKKYHFDFTHDLVDLAKNANVVYSDQDKQLLNILTHAIEWYGRYPVPKDNNKDKLKFISSLVEENLYDKELLCGDSELVIFSSNENLEWNSYNKLWCIAWKELTNVAEWIER